ncbi:MAG: RAD55 family ATPase [Candidatus Hodarchaeota archaeon]
MAFHADTKTDFARFGIPRLDAALGGGIPRGAVILLEDEVGVDKGPLMIQFLANGLRSGEYGYILSTEHLYDHYRRQLVPFEIDEIVVETKRLMFLDGFTNPFGYDTIGGGPPTAALSEGLGSGYQAFGQDNIIRDISQPRIVTDSIRIALNHVRPPQKVRGVIDSLTTLILVSDNLKAPLSFLQHQIAADKVRDRISILTIHRDAHDITIVKALEHYADGVLRLKQTSTGQVLEIVKMFGLPLDEIETASFEYKVSPGKISLTPLLKES